MSTSNVPQGEDDDIEYLAQGDVTELFQIPVKVATMTQAVDAVEDAIVRRERHQIGVVNAAKIVNMRRNPALRGAVLECDVIYADGMSVVWASRLLRRPLPARIAGIDLMHAILHRGAQKGFKIYCLGAKQEIINRVVDRFREDYSGVSIVGWRNGYFNESEEQEIAESVRQSRADVLFVAITSPKKEQFMARWADHMQVPVVHGVGGSFDVVGGLVKRAPKIWQASGFEWLYRVIQEPRRLIGRYLVTNTLFAWLLLKEALRPSDIKR